MFMQHESLHTDTFAASYSMMYFTLEPIDAMLEHLTENSGRPSIRSYFSSTHT